MARRIHQPTFVEPMIARLVQKLPEGDEWMYEVKFDGYRALLSKRDDDVRLRSRNDKDLAGAYPGIITAGRRLRRSALLDGEVVAVDRRGVPSFQALQHRSAYPNHTIVYYAFDVLYLEGENLTGRPLDERRRLLPEVIGDSGVLISETLSGTAPQVIEAVRGLGLEGVIAKRRTSRYEPGLRTGAWSKVKLERQQEFVVGGYRRGPLGVDALVVGYHEEDGLKFAAKVRAGFTPHLRREVFDRVKRLHTSRCPFVDLPSTSPAHWGGGVTPEQMTEMQWLKPTTVAQIRFVEWTADGHLRHSAFMGLRDDKRAQDVRRER
jgi:DNA ligase D-like protein (predicted ligase)